MNKIYINYKNIMATALFAVLLFPIVNIDAAIPYLTGSGTNIVPVMENGTLQANFSWNSHNGITNGNYCYASVMVNCGVWQGNYTMWVCNLYNITANIHYLILRIKLRAGVTDVGNNAAIAVKRSGYPDDGNCNDNYLIKNQTICGTLSNSEDAWVIIPLNFTNNLEWTRVAMIDPNQTYMIRDAYYCNSLPSCPVTCQTPIAGTASAASNPIAENTAAVITLSGYSGTIQWQVNNGGWQNVGGATSAVLTTAALPIGTYCYRAAVSAGNCPVVYSNEVCIEVRDTSEIDEDEDADCIEHTNTPAQDEYYLIQNVWYKSFMFDDGVDIGIVTGATNGAVATQGALRCAANITTLAAAKADVRTHWTRNALGSNNRYQIINVNTGRRATTEYDWSWYSGACGNNNGVNLIPPYAPADRNGATEQNDYIGFELTAVDSVFRLKSYRNGTYYLNLRNCAPSNDHGNAVIQGDYSVVYADDYRWRLYYVAAAPARYYPDLAISIIYAFPQTIALSGAVIGYVGIDNLGQEAVAAGTPIKFRIEFNGQYFYFIYTGGIGTGAGSYIELPFSFTPTRNTGGSFKDITVTINSNYAIDELNCDNNTITCNNAILVDSQ